MTGRARARGRARGQALHTTSLAAAVVSAGFWDPERVRFEGQSEVLSGPQSAWLYMKPLSESGVAAAARLGLGPSYVFLHVGLVQGFVVAPWEAA